MPRLFCALDIPASLKSTLSQFRSGLTGARWIDPQDYHITLRFFGDINRHIANDLSLALSGIDRHAFEVQFERLDAFGNSKPRSLHVSIKPDQSIMELQNEIDWLAKRLGMPKDNRKFSPHITLARLNGTTPLEVAGFIGASGGLPPTRFETEEFLLLSSKASRGGGPYIREARYPLRQFAF